MRLPKEYRVERGELRRELREYQQLMEGRGSETTGGAGKWEGNQDGWCPANLAPSLWAEA